MSLQLKSKPRIVQNRNSASQANYSIEDLARRSIFENLISYFRSGYLQEPVLIQSLQSLFPDTGRHKIQQLMPKIRNLMYAPDEDTLLNTIWEQLYE